ncbi:hypothetical protein FXV77_15365 [Sphingobacterium phlebotomi]|uniref:SusE-like outer membrane protein n=1 Tax=Sphingobacterium phlebotomi TaxID=2605433 RepID=A0A5D4H057_9SPHI|nr:hypothetical protein [Sphingobacterium phlebotomi]TYR34401.1 hypothetical protein FXV77_15365 [Sphingobacterium phlebotomi]
MKRLFSILMLLSLVVVSACRKSDNATMPDGIIYINQPHVTKVSGSPAILDDDPLGFEATVGVDLYFKDSNVKPDYLDLVVMKNGDAKNAKLLRGNISSYPVEFEVSGQLLTDLFGTIVAGDNFDFGTNYITGGTTYVAFPEGGGIGYGPNVAAQPDASPMVRYSAICSFIADDFLGDGKFEVITDGWADFGTGTVVDVVKVDESTISITYPIPGFNPITLNVDLGDNTVVVPQQPLGDYGNWPYGVVSVASTGGGTANYVNPCEGTIRINGNYTVSAGGFGAYVLELKKVQ